MRFTRLSHAGLLISSPEDSLIIDPGNFSDEREIAATIEKAELISAVVITHEHADHWTAENIRAIRKDSPAAPIYTTDATAVALNAEGIDGVEVVREGDRVTAGSFALEVYGRRHEVLHSSIPVIDNIGVRVNGTLAWGGDSLTRPPFEADLLGVPIGSPWSNIAQVMDFVLNAAPKRAFLTHDGMLSNKGLGLFTQRVQWCLDQFGGELVRFPHILDESE